MDYFGLDPSSYSIAIYFFLRLLGLIYIIAYVPLIFQIRGLFGNEGIEPAQTFCSRQKKQLGMRSFYQFPSLLWLNASDLALLALVWSGIICGTLLMLGIWSLFILILLFIIHLSLLSIGQNYLDYAPQTFLLQVTLA